MDGKRRSPLDVSSSQKNGEYYKLHEGRILTPAPTYGDAEPGRGSDGVDVQKWASVHCIWYEDELVSENGALTGRVRVWRYYTDATPPPFTQAQGRWVAGEYLLVGLNELGRQQNGTNNHFRLATMDCQRMFMQLISATNDEGDEPSYIMWRLYGYATRDSEHIAGIVSLSDESVATIANSETLAKHDVDVIDEGPQTLLDARSALPVAVSDGDAVRQIADLYGRAMAASFDLVAQADRVQEIDPLNEKVVAEQLVDTALSSYTGVLYYPSADGATMDGYRDLGATIHLVGGTTSAPADVTADLTLEVSNDDDANPATRQWIDVTPAGYRLDLDSTVGVGGTIQSVGASAVNTQVDWDELNVRRYRFRLELDDSPTGTDAEISIWTRRDAL